MANVLFMGGSILDYSSLVNRVELSFSSSSYSRTDFQPRAFTLYGGSPLANFMVGDFERATSNFWMSWRLKYESDQNYSQDNLNRTENAYLVFLNGDTKLFGLFNVGGVTLLKKYTNDAVSTTGYDAIMKPGWRTVDLYKMDIQVVLNGANSTVKLYQNGELTLDYTGNLAPGGTTVNRIYLASSSQSTGSAYYWSEVFAMERDTRTMVLKLHNPSANRADNGWAGTFADVNTDDYRNSATVMSTPTPEVAASLATTGLPNGSYRVRAVKVSAIVARGETGPSKVQLGVGAFPAHSNRSRVGAHNYWRIVVLKTRTGDPANPPGTMMTRLAFFDTLGEAQSPVTNSIGSGVGTMSAFGPGGPNNQWQSTAPLNWVGTRFDTPQTVSAFSYRTPTFSSSSNFNSNPTQIRVDYSDNGTDWTTAWTTPEYADPAQGDIDFAFQDPALARQPTYGDVKNADLSFSKMGSIFEQNPLTLTPWTGDDVNKMGIYLKSRA
jgi:hypothetical protein